jgi:hypothetical protein
MKPLQILKSSTTKRPKTLQKTNPSNTFQIWPKIWKIDVENWFIDYWERKRNILPNG